MRRDKAIKYFRIARFIANELSKDPNTKVGCLLLEPDTCVVKSIGFNGAPRGIDETRPERWERPEKYQWISHSEKNAICNAARSGTNINGSIAIITMYPCVDCCKALIQAGVNEIVTVEPNLGDPKWGEEFRYSQMMFYEVGINAIFLTSEEIK